MKKIHSIRHNGETDSIVITSHIRKDDSREFLMKAFLEGFLSIFDSDLERTQVRIQTITDDKNAIANDWEMVGKGVRHAMKEFQRQQMKAYVD